MILAVTAPAQLSDCLQGSHISLSQNFEKGQKKGRDTIASTERHVIPCSKVWCLCLEQFRKELIHIGIKMPKLGPEMKYIPHQDSFVPNTACRHFLKTPITETPGLVSGNECPTQTKE